MCKKTPVFYKVCHVVYFLTLMFPESYVDSAIIWYNIIINCDRKGMTVTPTCADHAGLVSHHAVTSHHALLLLLLLLYESVWAGGPYGVL